MRLGLATIWAKIETTRLATPSGLEALGMGYFKIWVGGFVGARPTACSTGSGDERWVQWFCDHWAIMLIGFLLKLEFILFNVRIWFV